MQKIIDFSNYENGYRDYGGSDSKKSIEYSGNKYMIKFPSMLEKTNEFQTSIVNNVISEYIGSHIMQSLEIETHDTLLGIYNGEPVVACKDFTRDGYRLQQFSWFMLSMYRKYEIGRIPTYKQIYDVIRNHPILRPISGQALDNYWEMFVGDALIGNFDRHKGNWGYLINEDTHDVMLAPVYDCGSCLYPEISDEKIDYVLQNEDEIEKRISVFPKSAINKNENPRKIEKYGYYELLSSDISGECLKALRKIAPKIDLNKINSIIENTPFISDIRIDFYKKMVKYRKERIIDKAYEILIQKEQKVDRGTLIRRINRGGAR